MDAVTVNSRATGLAFPVAESRDNEMPPASRSRSQPASRIARHIRHYARLVPTLLAIALLSLTATTAATAATDEKRVALVIGNSAYAAAPLDNPVNDANAIAAKLKRLGFEVILATNATHRQMDSAIRRFGNKLRGQKGVALFFFAGHGIEVGGANYLVPIGSNIEHERDVKYSAVNAGRVLDEMEASSNRINIMVLDACRNNPYARSSRSGVRGLAKMNAPTGSLVAFSTAPRNVAHDGPPGGNSVYTSQLLKYIGEPGLPIEQMFKRVRQGVMSDTGKAQVPWEESSLIGDFYFKPAAKAPIRVASAAPTTARPVKSTTSFEMTFWRSIKNSRSSGDFRAYLDTYPSGHFAPLARLKLRRLEGADTSSSTPVTVSHAPTPSRTVAPP